jgi:hypothetical protein
MPGILRGLICYVAPPALPFQALRPGVRILDGPSCGSDRRAGSYPILSRLMFILDTNILSAMMIQDDINNCVYYVIAQSFLSVLLPSLQ